MTTREQALKILNQSLRDVPADTAREQRQERRSDVKETRITNRTERIKIRQENRSNRTSDRQETLRTFIDDVTDVTEDIISIPAGMIETQEDVLSNLTKPSFLLPALAIGGIALIFFTRSGGIQQASELAQALPF